MELPIYESLAEFKEYHEDNLFNFPELNKLELLRKYQNLYIEKGKENYSLHIENSAKLFQLANNYNLFIKDLGLTNELSPLFINHSGIILNQIVKEVRAKKKLTKLDKEFISDQLKKYQETSEAFATTEIRQKNIINILDFIDERISNEKTNLLRFQQQPATPPETEPDPLTDKQIEKIGLFIRSGIIDFLRKKNPKISNRKIASFIRELTSEQLENSESIKAHLTTDINSSKHPFYKDGSKIRYDLKLKNFGISPQSEQ